MCLCVFSFSLSLSVYVCVFLMSLSCYAVKVYGPVCVDEVCVCISDRCRVRSGDISDAVESGLEFSWSHLSERTHGKSRGLWEMNRLASSLFSLQTLALL